MGYLLVLGFPGSGTTYTANLLKHLGQSVEHESLNGSFGAVSFRHFGEELPTETIVRDGKAEVKPLPCDVIHLVRDPFEAIKSAAALDDGTIALLRNRSGQPAIPIDGAHARLTVCLRAYPVWHDMIMELEPKQRIRIEALEGKKEFRRLAKWARTQDDINPVVLGEGPRNSRKGKPRYTDLTLDGFRAIDEKATQKVLKLRKLYGY